MIADILKKYTPKAFCSDAIGNGKFVLAKFENHHVFSMGDWETCDNVNWEISEGDFNKICAAYNVTLTGPNTNDSYHAITNPNHIKNIEDSIEMHTELQDKINAAKVVQRLTI